MKASLGSRSKPWKKAWRFPRALGTARADGDEQEERAKAPPAVSEWSPVGAGRWRLLWAQGSVYVGL